MGRPDSVSDSGHDCFGHAIGIIANVTVPISQDPPAEAFEEQRAPIIVGDAPVEFDRNLDGAAREVEDIAADRKLPREARAQVAKT